MATLRRFVLDGQGLTTISGTAAFTLRRFKVNTAVKYNVSVESRAVYVGPKRNSFGEVFDLVIYCNFQDTHPYIITLQSDFSRYSSSEDYHTNESIENNQAAAGQIEFRQSIQCVPEEGFVGTFFQYSIAKKLARDGKFEYTGADINYIPRPELGPEFISKMGDINNGWE